MEKWILIQETNYNKIKEKISQNKDKEIIFSSDDDELNKKVLEKLKINTFLVLLTKRKDYQKQRNSGFNQVMSKIAKKNNINLAFNIDEIIESQKSIKSQLIARIIQNIEICKKQKIPIKFISLNKKFNKDVKDLKSFGIILGMPTWMTKKISLLK